MSQTFTETMRQSWNNTIGVTSDSTRSVAIILSVVNAFAIMPVTISAAGYETLAAWMIPVALPLGIPYFILLIGFLRGEIR